MSSSLIEIEFDSKSNEVSEEFNYRNTPFIVDDRIYKTKIKTATKITNSDDVKSVFNVSFDLTDFNYNFSPGGTIGILPQNRNDTIEKLFIRLNINSVADKQCELKIRQKTLKKNPKIPKHLPPKSTLRNIFLKHVDVQTPPRKIFLKSLAQFTQDPEERIKLEKITSEEYNKLICKAKTLLSLLEFFPSCCPPVEVLLEHLPPLQPRVYSISSSILSGKIEITFFVLVHEDGTKGLCTGWLENLILEKEICEAIVPIYFRQPTKFRLPEDLSIPLILIATGTGIAPFRAFLQHRKLLGRSNNKIWLFYGCRSQEDFLFKEELHEYLGLKTLTKLDVAFSREKDSKCYVQDKIVKNKEIFSEWVLEKEAFIFVCGDAKTMVKDVKKCLNGLFQNDNFVGNLETEGRFIIDSWI